MHTWVKVCGLTRSDDVAAAVAAGADAIGLVLAESSPRRVDLTQAAALADGVPALRILVTVDARPESLLEAVAVVGADGVQPHGEHAADSAAAAAAAGLLALRPIPMTAAGPSVALEQIPVDQIPLFDTGHRTLHGGTGTSFPWDLAAGVDRRFVLAGGLGPDNVADAIRVSGAWGVDASSRLESAPGLKDHGRVAAFVREAKRMEARPG